jgi:ABC-type transport system involved in multi-copper enzyme maturation permease subunit
MTATMTPYRSGHQAGRVGFAQLLHSEWTKFRTVRGWVIALAAVTLATVGLGLLTASGSICSYGPFPGQPVALACTDPVGPGGEAVSDSFYFVHQPLPAHGSITAEVTSLTGQYASNAVQHTQGAGPDLRPGLGQWSKAGLIIKAGTTAGSAYAAILVTGGHGVRMQDNYTGDTPGLAGPVSAASPRWLRLTRSGAAVTGYDSADGTHWTRVGTVTLAGLPAAVPAGLFATSPPYTRATSQSLGSSSSTGGPSQATGVFSHLSLPGSWSPGGWRAGQIGGPQGEGQPSFGDFRQHGGRLTVSGSGDIAPAVAGGADPGSQIGQTLSGAFAGLIIAVVIGVVFITGEYRRGLIRTTLAASPQRGRVLAAKAIVIGAVTFAAGLVAAAVAVPLGERILRAHGNFIFPVSPLTEMRVMAGTAAVLAVAAVLALGIGALLRRGAEAVTAAIVVTVLPYLLATTPVLPAGAAAWLLRVTPAAGFAIQQGVPRYPQVASEYLPFNGYYPLAPWAGFAVLCGWAAVALGLAVVVLRRRDA